MTHLFAADKQTVVNEVDFRNMEIGRTSQIPDRNTVETHSLDLTSANFKRDPLPTISRIRDMGPVIRTRMPFLGNVWLTTNHATTSEVLRNKETFVTNPANAGRRGIAGFRWWMPRTIRAITTNMLGKDEPDHRRLRKIVESAFLRQSIECMRARIATLAEQQLNVLEEQAARAGGQVDFVKHFARPFPLSVISELLGLPESDRKKIMTWAARFTNIKNSTDLFKAFPAIWKISRYFRQQFSECRILPRPGMISALVAAEQEEGKLDEEELLATAFLLLLAGHETTVHLIAAGLLSLLQHPVQKQQLTQDWSKIDTAINEMLRYNSTVQTTEPRYIANDTCFHGVAMSRGEVIMPFLAAANADPEQFPNPETFDISRSPNQHLAFGNGIHTCLGMRLAKAEATTAFQQFFARFPDFELAVPEGQIQWSEGVGTRSLLGLPLQLNLPV